jgi:hypothetical protein
MVWQFHVFPSKEEEGDILLVQMISTCLHGAQRKGGEELAPCDKNRSGRRGPIRALVVIVRTALCVVS